MSRFSASFLARARFSTFTAAGLFGLAAAAACSSAGSGDATGSAAAGRQQATSAASLDLPSGFTRLPRSHHPLAQARYDIGPADVTKNAAGSVYLKLSAAQKADRDALLLAVQDPRSPSYHQWLTPEDYAARFGATTATIAGVSSFLRSQGLQVDGASPLGTRIGFHGTRDQVQRTFHAEMHDYVVAGKKHFALATPPAIPAQLEEVVLGIKGLHDFHPRANGIRHRPVTPDYSLPFSKATSLGPDDFKVLYDTKPLLSAGTDGTGITIAVVGQSYYSTAGLNDFLGKFSLTNRMTDVLVPGTGAQKITGDADEADLDVEWSSATAPGANIVFVYTGADGDNYGVDDAAAYVVERGRNLVPGTGNGGAQIISESYGACDGEYPDDGDLVGETAAAANLEGITYLGASGDDGAAGCIQEGVGGLSVGPPSSLPGVTGVGGTEFPAAAQVAPYFVNKAAVEYPLGPGGTLLETTWNDESISGGGAGGGGASSIFPKPFYQQGVTPADGARDVPDVSLSGSNENLPYYVVLQNGPTGFGGTSCSTPSFAGILALVGQAVKAQGGPLGLGNINPLLYKLAKSAPSAFHDIVSGNNDTPCTPGTDPDCPANGSYGGFSAGPGYDQVTGLGSIDAANLVAAWTALAPTTTTVATGATTTTVTTPVNLTAHVTTTGGGALTGTVSFTFQTTAGPLGAVYAPDGAANESWVLGTVPITVSGSSGDAQLDTVIPPGITGSAFVVALYNGDDTHLASVSSAKAVSITGSSLALGPTGLTLRPNEKTTLTATGGTAPITWFTISPDTTCIFDDAQGTANCSDVEALTPTTSATLTAGPQDGTVKVVAKDALGQEALLEVTVAGAPLDAGAPDSGAAADAAAPVADSGSGPSPVQPEDAGSSKPDAAAPVRDASVPVTGEADAAAPSDGGDAGSDERSDSGDSGGCSVAHGSRDSTSGAGALLAALAFVVTRRKRRRPLVTG